MKNIITRTIGLYLNALATVSPRYAGRTGFQLFCRPFRPKMNEKQHAFFNTADKLRIAIDDHDLQGYKWGNGSKKIVFFHGWQSHSYRWKMFIENISKEEYTIYALDAPGHGFSSGSFLSVPVYSNIIHQFLMSLGNVHAVIGHSIGGFSTLYALYQYPLIPIQKLVLLAPPGEATEFVESFRSTLGLSNRALDSVAEHFVKTYNVGPEFFSASKFARSLNMHGLVIHDEHDVEAPYQHGLNIHKNWKRSRLITTTGLGHNLRSASVVEDVVSFISQPVTERMVV